MLHMYSIYEVLELAVSHRTISDQISCMCNLTLDQNKDFLHVTVTTFPRISYTYLAEDRAEFYANK